MIARRNSATGLATRYVIETAVESGKWRIIAGSADRQPYVAGAPPRRDCDATGLSAGAAAELKSLLARADEARNRLGRLKARPKIYGGVFAEPEATYLLYRGDPLQKREQVAPSALEAFGTKTHLQPNSPEQERRLTLGRWIVDPKNPMTARVMVNRIWQHHFGEGLVGTPSDFGLNGARPSHPELLDWLAVEFQQRGWSIKSMHRLMVLSSASSPGQPTQFARLASRWLRPAALAIQSATVGGGGPCCGTRFFSVSGKLNLRMGGPGFSLFDPNDNYVRVYNSRKDFGPEEWRRMIYETKARMQLDNTFGAFDCPDGGQIAPRRNSSTTPLQALNLLNSPFAMQQAGFLAERLRGDAGAEVKAQVRRAFRLLFSREPSRGELAAARQLVEREGLLIFCRAMLNANEFVYVF